MFKNEINGNAPWFCEFGTTELDRSIFQNNNLFYLNYFHEGRPLGFVLCLSLRLGHVPKGGGGGGVCF